MPFPMPSSSSSSSYEEALELFTTLITQGHHDILPFSFMIERGNENSTTFPFSFVTQTNNCLNYDAIISLNSNTVTTTSTVFIPEVEEAQYKHEPMFYVDLIIEGKGVQKYSLRSQSELYEYETPSLVFNIPKFSWDNSIFGIVEESESSVDVNEGYVWVGTSSKMIHKLSYDLQSASNIYAANASSEVYAITFGQDNNNTYVSCYDHLTTYLGTSYYSSPQELVKEAEILNSDNDIFTMDDLQSGNVISTEAYSGKVIFRDRTTLTIVQEYSGFDAPFKVVWSSAHACYLVAGTHTLWKLQNGQKTAVYNIKDYSIVDFDCSEGGVVGILFRGTNVSIIRFLDKNFYSLLYTANITDGDVRYCKYCEQGKFYVLVELSSEDAYSSRHYLFDSINKTLNTIDSVNETVTTTTTTTLPAPTHKVEMVAPVSTDVWQKGLAHDIKWRSSASIVDVVKIELYKGIILVDTIVQQTGNTGVYSWTIANTYANGSDYSIRVTWLSAGDTSNYDDSDSFSITDIPQTTTTTTTKIIDRAVGVGYNSFNSQIVIVLSNGLVGVYQLDDNTFYGLFESSIGSVSCVAIKDRKVNKFTGVNKVRVFVGSEVYLSDMWDSDIIETDKTSIYYGGKSLTPGKQYFVNIQVYSEKYGWSETQSKSFILPK